MHRLRNLNIYFVIRGSGDEVYLGIIDLTYRHIVTAAQEFKIYDVFDRVTAVAIPEAEKIIPQSDVNDIILAKGAKILLALDIEPLDFIDRKSVV